MRPITPEPASPSADRFADLRVTADERLLVCVRERHPVDGGEAGNELVMLPTEPELPGRVWNAPCPPPRGVPALPGTAAPYALADGLASAWLGLSE